MMISSPAARRRYFEKSSLSSANATFRISGCLFVEPFLRIRFLEDGKDFDRCFLDVIKHPYFINSQAILRSAYPPETLDPAFAQLGWFVSQVNFESVTNLTPDTCFQLFVRSCGIGSQDDLVPHSGYIMA